MNNYTEQNKIMNNEKQLTNPPSTPLEGTPAIEEAERQIFGNNYEKVEIIHRFSDNHPWFHPVLVSGVIVIIVCIVLATKHKLSKQSL
ncbi:MAG: hypothetical protein Q7K40_03880 [bacterium]|nr:hypothetical protein [bacterium]